MTTLPQPPTAHTDAWAATNNPLSATHRRVPRVRVLPPPHATRAHRHPRRRPHVAPTDRCRHPRPRQRPPPPPALPSPLSPLTPPAATDRRGHPRPRPRRRRPQPRPSQTAASAPADRCRRPNRPLLQPPPPIATAARDPIPVVAVHPPRRHLQLLPPARSAGTPVPAAGVGLRRSPSPRRPLSLPSPSGPYDVAGPAVARLIDAHADLQPCRPQPPPLPHSSSPPPPPTAAVHPASPLPSAAFSQAVGAVVAVAAAVSSLAAPAPAAVTHNHVCCQRRGRQHGPPPLPQRPSSLQPLSAVAPATVPTAVCCPRPRHSSRRHPPPAQLPRRQPVPPPPPQRVPALLPSLPSPATPTTAIVLSHLSVRQRAPSAADAALPTAAPCSARPHWMAAAVASAELTYSGSPPAISEV